MKFASMLIFSALLSVTACSHHKKSCCSDSCAKDQKACCSKESCPKDKDCCKDKKCDDGSCRKEVKKEEKKP